MTVGLFRQCVSCSFLLLAVGESQHTATQSCKPVAGGKTFKCRDCGPVVLNVGYDDVLAAESDFIFYQWFIGVQHISFALVSQAEHTC